MKNGKPARVIIAASERDSNLYYATRFIAPDPFIFVEVNGRKILVMSELEIDRAREQASVDEILSVSKIVKKLRSKGLERISTAHIVDHILKEHHARSILVPDDFPISHADPLRSLGYKVDFKRDPFYEERVIKSAAEVKAIEQALKDTERAILKAIAVLKKSKIKGKYLYHQGKRLTSEMIKQVINVSLMESNCIAAHTIVSCGIQCVDPHNQGSGPLLANESIIMDVFPHSSESRYFADTTRTVVRGKANPKLKKMYQAVRDGQEIAYRGIREGANGRKIHEAIMKLFEERGFKTGELNSRMQGFFHGTGHGVGLDIHEMPRIGGVDDILKAGQIVTVEPGLYYEDAGGVRIEDMVLVTKTGCRNLSKLPKVLEI